MRFFSKEANNSSFFRSFSMFSGRAPSIAQDAASAAAPGSLPRRDHPSAVRLHRRGEGALHGSAPRGVSVVALGEKEARTIITKNDPPPPGQVLAPRPQHVRLDVCVLNKTPEHACTCRAMFCARSLASCIRHGQRQDDDDNSGGATAPPAGHLISSSRC